VEEGSSSETVRPKGKGICERRGKSETPSPPAAILRGDHARAAAVAAFTEAIEIIGEGDAAVVRVGEGAVVVVMVVVVMVVVAAVVAGVRVVEVAGVLATSTLSNAPRLRPRAGVAVGAGAGTGAASQRAHAVVDSNGGTRRPWQWRRSSGCG